MLARYLFALPLLACPTDAWQPFSLDKYVSVQLPVVPTEMTGDMGLPAGTHAYVGRMGKEIYQLIGPMAIPATVKVEEAEGRQDFYNGVVSGMVTDEGNVLLARASFSTSVGEGLAVTFRVPATPAHKEMVMFNRAFIVNHNSYILTFFRTDGDTIEGATRRHFFNSLTVKP